MTEMGRRLPPPRETWTTDASARFKESWQAYTSGDFVDADLMRRCEAVLVAPIFEPATPPTVHDIARVIARSGGSATKDELADLAGVKRHRGRHYEPYTDVVAGHVRHHEYR